MIAIMPPKGQLIGVCHASGDGNPDKSFKLVVFDPPHLVWAGKASNLYKRYGKLDNWEETLRKGVDEYFRVLDDYGVLVFKWAETQLKVKTVLKAIGHQPLFGHKRSGTGKTIWLCFMKMPDISHVKKKKEEPEP